jgi:hypothetical protein
VVAVEVAVVAMERQVSLLFLRHLVHYHLIMAAEAEAAVELVEQILPAVHLDPQMVPMRIPAAQVKSAQLPQAALAGRVLALQAQAALAEIGVPLAIMAG